MIKLNLIIVTLLFITIGNAQEQQTIAKLLIKHAKWNTTDISKETVLQRGIIVFYFANDDTTLYMSNVRNAGNSQSFGPLIPIKNDSSDVDIHSGNIESISYQWSYYNTYDGQAGLAEVKVLKIKNPYKGNTYAIKIFPENQDILNYNGEFLGANNIFK